MTSDQLGALIAAFRQAVADVRDNTAPPPPIASSGSLADRLQTVSDALPSIISSLRAYQGVETGLVDVLNTLDHLGFAYAAPIRELILEAPSLLADAEAWLPGVLFALHSFQPAATGIVGDRGYNPTVSR